MLAAAVLGFFVVTLDAVVVNVALPSIRDELGGGITGLQWVVDGYTLMFAALLLSAGSLTDRFGVAGPVWMLALLMVPVGVAGPLVMPPMIAILLNAVPPARAGTASGVFNTSRQLGGALAVAVFGAVLGSPAGFVHGLRISLLIAAVVALAAAAAGLLLDSQPRPIPAG